MPLSVCVVGKVEGRGRAGDVRLAARSERQPNTVRDEFMGVLAYQAWT